MPRSVRIEYPGARYHVINRGNYRQDLFTIHKTGEAFEKALLEACVRYNWKLHAYVVMSNHYHLCLETEEANLQNGMQWLQSVFANRFNKFNHCVGHVFQGRYRALLVGDEEGLLELVNYIHLNPVRARIVSLEKLKQYGLSSFGKFFKKKRSGVMVCREWLHEAGNLKDTAWGMRKYHQYLAFCEEKDNKERAKRYKHLCRGWYIGTKEGKRLTLEALREGKLAAISEAKLSRTTGEDFALSLLRKGLRVLKKKNEDIKNDRKGSEWKLSFGIFN